MTQISIDDSSAEIRLSPASFRAASTTNPISSRSAQAAARTSGLCSPIPPVNTSASQPPSTARYAPMYFLMRYTKTSNASVAATSPDARRSRIVRISESPDTPNSPLAWLRSSTTSVTERPVAATRCSTTAGSRSPDRVPITRPSNGDRPIDVSTLRPQSIAAIDAPLPRGAVISRTSESGRPRTSAARWATTACEAPWNPYRRTPWSRYHASGIAYR